MTLTMFCRRHREYDPVAEIAVDPQPPLGCGDCEDMAAVYLAWRMALRRKLERAKIRSSAQQPDEPAAPELDGDIPRPRPDQVAWANEAGTTRRRMIDEELHDDRRTGRR